MIYHLQTKKKERKKNLPFSHIFASLDAYVNHTFLNPTNLPQDPPFLYSLITLLNIKILPLPFCLRTLSHSWFQSSPNRSSLPPPSPYPMITLSLVGISKPIQHLNLHTTTKAPLPRSHLQSL